MHKPFVAAVMAPSRITDSRVIARNSLGRTATPEFAESLGETARQTVCCLLAKDAGKEGCPMSWFSDPRYLLSGAIIAPMMIMALVHYAEVMARWKRAQRANLAAAKFATEQTFVCVYERMDMSVLCHPVDKLAPIRPPRDVDTDPAFLRSIEEAADRAIARYGLERVDLPREVGTF